MEEEGVQFSSEEIQSLEQRKSELQKELERSHRSKKIDLTSCQVDDLDALQVALYLTEKPHPIIALHLGANNMTDEGMCALASTLHTHEELEELYVGNNQFSNKGSVALINSLQFLPNLRILSMGGCELTDIEVTKLCFTCCCMTQCSLTQLFLNNNKIGNVGLFTLSILLAQVDLQIMHLGDNNFGYEGLKLLCEAIENSDSLHTLYLNDNEMDELSIYAITKSVFQNQSLIQLNLGGCELNDSHIEVLNTGLRGNISLEMLHLWGNSLTQASCQVIIETLENYNQTMSYVSLHNNQIEDYENYTASINELLKQNQMFRQETLLGIQQGKEERKELAKGQDA